MNVPTFHSHRRGAILPLLALAIIPMFAFVALAIDIGLLAVTKNQCQNAADAAALAGARTLDGSTNSDPSKVQSKDKAVNNAKAVAQANYVTGGLVASGDVTVQLGSYHYGPPTGGGASYFYPVLQDPPTAPDNLNLCQVTVSHNGTYGFAGIFSYFTGGNTSNFQVAASSIAAHRPRDVAIVLDFSGSMNNESDLWNCETYLNSSTVTRTNTSNNSETVYPLFGHYSNQTDYTNYLNYANLLSPASSSAPTNSLKGDSVIGMCNITTSVQGVSAIVGDLYSNSRGSTAASAFTTQPDSYKTTPAGDNYLGINGASPTPYATNVFDIIGGSATSQPSLATVKAWEGSARGGTGTGGYYTKNGNNTFNGYTVGPRYWGKTFFVWPPDPNNDWRKKYFFKSDGTTPLDDNTLLFQQPTSSNGYIGFKDPIDANGTNYVINYKAILAWIKNTSGTGNVNPFPTQMRSGNILFYSAIPTDVPASAYNWNNANSAITDLDQRFWKEYIDFALGVWKSPDGVIQRPNNPACSYGPEFVFGTYQVSAKPTTPVGNDGTFIRYMNYADNPGRPRHRMWFGPMTLIQYMMDSGNFTGAAHDVSMYPMKQGIGSALLDIQNNHPNNLVALCPFARPVYQNETGLGFFNAAVYNLNNDYNAMVNAMWVPTNTGSADIRPWDASGNPNQAPRAHGDYDSNTASQYGLMLAYNQFSGNTTLQATAGAGGYGRKGAGKIVIFETDGMYNIRSDPVSAFVNGNPAAYNSYYSIRNGLDQVKVNNTTANSDCLAVAQAICNKSDGTALSDSRFTPYTPNPGYPGYSSPGNPAFIQCIVFGVVFQVSNTNQSNAVTLVQQISQTGGTTFPSSSTDAANGWRWCIGDLATRQSKIKTAILNIFDSDVPVSLIK